MFWNKNSYSLVQLIGFYFKDLFEFFSGYQKIEREPFQLPVGTFENDFSSEKPFDPSKNICSLYGKCWARNTWITFKYLQS